MLLKVLFVLPSLAWPVVAFLSWIFSVIHQSYSKCCLLRNCLGGAVLPQTRNGLLGAGMN